MKVQTGDNVGIGGFIIAGTAPKHVLLRAIGPSLAQFGVPDVLADPVMELHGPGGFATITNDNWQDDPVQAALIIATGLQPANNLESAIDATLAPGNYTAVVRGKNSTTGVALVEVYDVSQAVPAKLANISTRAFVGTGDDIVIAGFILGGNSGADRIVVRGIGPSLTSVGVPNALANPTLELRDNNGALLAMNNDWQDNPAQAAELIAAGLAPTNQLESGIAATLAPGALHSAARRTEQRHRNRLGGSLRSRRREWGGNAFAHTIGDSYRRTYSYTHTYTERHAVADTDTFTGLRRERRFRRHYDFALGGLGADQSQCAIGNNRVVPGKWRRVPRPIGRSDVLHCRQLWQRRPPDQPGRSPAASTRLRAPLVSLAPRHHRRRLPLPLSTPSAIGS